MSHGISPDPMILPILAKIDACFSWTDHQTQEHSVFYNHRSILVSCVAIGPREELSAWALGLQAKVDEPWSIQEFKPETQASVDARAMFRTTPGGHRSALAFSIGQDGDQTMPCSTYNALASEANDSALDRLCHLGLADFRAALSASGFEIIALGEAHLESGSARETPPGLWTSFMTPNPRSFKLDESTLSEASAKGLARIEQLAMELAAPTPASKKRPAL